MMRRAVLGAMVPFMLAGNAAMAAACPSSAEIPEKVAAARFVLENPPSAGKAAALPGEEVLINGLVDFIVARGKAEVQVWFVRSVVDTLCTRADLKDYFTSTCDVYQSVLFKDVSSLAQADLSALANNVKTDVTYAPACALYGKISVALSSVTLPLPVGADPAKYKEGIASLGYYYTAVAKKATEPVDDIGGLFAIRTVAAAAGAAVSDTEVSYDGKPVVKISGLSTLAAWRGVSAATQGDYSTAVTQIASFLLGSGKPTSDRVSTALRTAIALASAKDAETVSSILDSVASPVGTWAVKQSRDDSTSTFVTSLTALPGVQASRDRLDSSVGKVSTTSYGLFLPVGIQFSRALNKGAISLMLAPIDAGAVISYSDKKKVDGATVESTAPITWESIVAPGIYLSYSLPKAPFVLGLGYQRAPNLRSVSLDNDTEEIASADRTLLFFSVDVTMFLHAR